MTVTENVDYRRSPSCASAGSCGRCGAALMPERSAIDYAAWSIAVWVETGRSLPDLPDDVSGALVCPLCGDVAWVA
jgi:hypothetical protein